MDGIVSQETKVYTASTVPRSSFYFTQKKRKGTGYTARESLVHLVSRRKAKLKMRTQ